MLSAQDPVDIQQEPLVKTEPDAVSIKKEAMQIDEPVIKAEPTHNVATSSYEPGFLDNLKLFYQKLFPFKLFYRWLSYGLVQKNYFSFREFSFTLPSDAYLRFHSFADGDELKNQVVSLNPVKIDIGAVYNTHPKNRKSVRQGAFQPLERELVFDIDMTDYDEIRTCCSGGDICKKCWKFMTISIKIIDRVLRDDFGFKHLLWVYSGRRGVHCWVCDERARKLTAEGRKAIVGYIEVVKGGEGQDRKVNLPRHQTALHPSLQRSEMVLQEYFAAVVLKGQEVLGTKEHWTKLLQLIPDEEMRKTLDAAFSEAPEASSLEKWERLVSEIQMERKRKSALNNVIRDIVFQYAYPRLDDHVTTGLNHLLKSPFCIHPKTGRVCVPIDPTKCDQFDPFNVPTLSQLVEQVETSQDSELNDTALFPYIQHFKHFLAGIDTSIRDALREKRAEEDKKLLF